MSSFDSRHNYSSSTSRFDGKRRRPPSLQFSSYDNIYSLDSYLPESGHTSVTEREYGRYDPMESLAEEDFDPANIKDVYKELQAINNKLKGELQLLHERSDQVNERERAVREMEAQMDTSLVDVKRTFESEVRQLEEIIKQKTKENRRLGENFETVKTSNVTLKSQMEAMQVQLQSLEKQNSCLQGRLNNLLKKKPVSSSEPLINSLDKPLMTKTSVINKPVRPPTAVKSKAAVPNKQVQRLTLTLMDMVVRLSLRQAVIAPSKSSLTRDECQQIVPSVVELLVDTVQSRSTTTLPLLTYLYWSLRYVDATAKPQRQVLSTTLRHLGECVFNEYVLVNPPLQPPDYTPVESPPVHDPHSHLLASLLTLICLNQADRCASALEVLRQCVQSAEGKQQFVHYHATSVLLPYLRPANKVLCSTTLDVYVHMVMEGDQLEEFLTSCSNPPWFQAVSLVWTMPTVQQSLLEKVSILLQKLSKVKATHRQFEVCGLTAACQDMVRSDLSPFLLLNIKSILFNLTLPK